MRQSMTMHAVLHVGHRAKRDKASYMDAKQAPACKSLPTKKTVMKHIIIAAVLAIAAATAASAHPAQLIYVANTVPADPVATDGSAPDGVFSEGLRTSRSYSLGAKVQERTNALSRSFLGH